MKNYNINILKKRMIKFFKKNWFLISLVYVPILIYFQKYITILIYFISTVYTVFLFDHPKIKKFLEEKRQNDANLLYHYKNEKGLRVIYIFTRTVYVFAFINFICHGAPIFQKYSVPLFYTIVFSLIIDFISCVYIIRNKNFPKKVTYLVQTYGLRLVTVLLPSYAGYSMQNPTSSFSHPYHLYGPKPLGALGAIAYSDVHLTQIDHLRTVYRDQSLNLFLDANGVPNLSIMKFHIHSNPVEYVRWRTSLPVNLWPAYGLDKPIGEILDEELLDELKFHGVVGKVTVLENIKKIKSI
jgi:hypothetical protein